MIGAEVEGSKSKEGMAQEKVDGVCSERHKGEE